MLYKATTALHKILTLRQRLKVIQGGSSAGKTIAILLILIDRAQSEKGKVFSIVSESMPHLKRAAMRDFLHILSQHNYYKDDNWDATNSIYTFPETGSIIEFFSAKDSDKIHGPRRSVLFINECNNVPFEVYTQLAIRTSEEIYLDYNPVQEFWVQTDVIPFLKHDFIILTYKDNEGLPQAIIEELESRKQNSQFWKVYGLGLMGELQGQIYSDWRVIDEIPHEARLERIGLDFGFTHDPAALVAIYYYNGGYILDEIAYQKRLSNKMLADIIKNQPITVVAADSAEPKSIEELKTYDITLTPVKKGKDSIRQGIQLVQSQRISVTAQSLNIIKEFRNYSWATDNLGKPVKPETPVDNFNHAMDAIRYAFQTISPTYLQEKDEEEQSNRLLARLRHLKPKG